MQEYLTLTSILRLPKETWVKARRRIVRLLIHIGTMHGQFDLLAMSHDNEFYVAGADVTRVTVNVEAVVDPNGSNHLEGPCFPPNPLEHPTRDQMPSIPPTFSALQEFVDNQHEAENIAVNVNLTGLNCPTDPSKTNHNYQRLSRRPQWIYSYSPSHRMGHVAVFCDSLSGRHCTPSHSLHHAHWRGD